MDRIHNLVNKYTEDIIAYRRHIHAHPEISGQEIETAAYIAQQLRKIGIPIIENVGGHGVVGLIHGAHPGRCVGLRADMDALSIQETTNSPFASQNDGISHACGHDCHTAMLLGAAQVLYDLRDSFDGTIKLVFQPSEETSNDSGALRMIKDGVLENPKVDLMIGQHMNPTTPTGKIGFRAGAMTASSNRFYIDIYGKSCHGSSPDEGIDAIVIAAEIIQSLQNIISRQISPFANSVITIGKINGGDRYNVVAGHVSMEGTCRNTSTEVGQIVAEKMEKIIRGITQFYGAQCEFRYLKGYAPLMNDSTLASDLTAVADSVLGSESVIEMPHPMMGGEDFSFFTHQVPSVFYWLGCQSPNDTVSAPLHNGAFNPDENALALGCEVMVTAAMQQLKK